MDVPVSVKAEWGAGGGGILLLWTPFNGLVLPRQEPQIKALLTNRRYPDSGLGPCWGGSHILYTCRGIMG